MKKNLDLQPHGRGLLSKFFIKMKVVFFILLFSALNASAVFNVQAQQVTLNVKKASFESILDSIEKYTDYTFLFSVEDVESISKIDVNVVNESLFSILDDCLEGTDLKYNVVEKNVVIVPKETDVQQAVPQKQKYVKVVGNVTDVKGNPIPGVSVVLDGTMQGVSTDSDGYFSITCNDKEKIVLRFSFIGFKTKKVEYKGEALTVQLPESSEGLNEVVVNSYYSQNKNTSTGAVTTIRSEELLEVSTTNIFQAIATLTPGMHIVENNAAGSNPNRIPDIVIRGMTSISTTGQRGLNTPLIMLDGVQIKLEELYDLDIYEIDRVDVLKDASSTAIYGEKGANGVIIITRKRGIDKGVKVKYNFTPSYIFPDVSSFNLCSPYQKLQVEKLAGLYDLPGGAGDDAYLKKLELVNSGTNTDWIEKPLRIAYGHSHSLNLRGKGSNNDYGTNVRYSDNRGVMKGDYRKLYGMGFYFGFSPSDKLRINYRTDINITNSKASPYGDYSNYAEMNPYYPEYDSEGELNYKFEFNEIYPGQSTQFNPLYDVKKTSNFNKTSNMSIRSVIDLKWDIAKNLFLTSNLSYRISKNKTDLWISPLSARYVDGYQPVNERGERHKQGGEASGFSGQVVASYSKSFGDGTALTIRAGGNYDRSETNNFAFSATGFSKDRLNNINFANSYNQLTLPSGQENTSISLGGFVNSNFVVKNRYYVDASYRFSGNSLFGKNNLYAPFWSVGLGWNLDKEEWLQYDWISSLKLRVSCGINGSVNFSPYQSKTTYRYTKGLNYSFIGVEPMDMGNPDLTWQTTTSINAGLMGAFFNNRLSINFNYWEQNTTDMLMTVGLPSSVGIEKTSVNYGEVENKGYEMSLSAVLLKNTDWTWRASASGSRSADKLQKISQSLKKRNEELNTNNKVTVPNYLFKEGESQYAIYAVRSGGIDPATGREIYITKDGGYTMDYNPEDKVVVGNSNPWIRGSFTTNLRYKNFSIGMSSNLTLGGDTYNGTLAQKVENIDPRINVDQRVFTERWKKPGDVVSFLGIPEYNTLKPHTSRFVSRLDEIHITNINIGYSFNTKSLNKYGLKKLRIGFGMGDVARFSTVKYERGTSYPFARNFNFTLSPTF